MYFYLSDPKGKGYMQEKKDTQVKRSCMPI